MDPWNEEAFAGEKAARARSMLYALVEKLQDKIVADEELWRNHPRFKLFPTQRRWMGDRIASLRRGVARLLRLIDTWQGPTRRLWEGTRSIDAKILTLFTRAGTLFAARVLELRLLEQSPLIQLCNLGRMSAAERLLPLPGR